MPLQTIQSLQKLRIISIINIIVNEGKPQCTVMNYHFAVLQKEIEHKEDKGKFMMHAVCIVVY